MREAQRGLVVLDADATVCCRYLFDMEFTHYKGVSSEEGAGGVPEPGLGQEISSGNGGADQKVFSIC